LTNTLVQFFDTAQINRFFPKANSAEILRKSLKDIYSGNSGKLLWTHYYGLNNLGDSLIRTLSLAYKDGLDPHHYNLKLLKELQNDVFDDERFTPDQKLIKLVELDVYYSAVFLSYLSDLATGSIDPRSFDAVWKYYPKNVNFKDVLNKVSEGGNFFSSLRQVRPEDPQYVLLLQELHKYQQIAKNGGWEKIEKNDVISKGDSSQVVVKIRERLFKEGFLSKNNKSYEFGADLYLAIHDFQKAHGIEKDGALGPETRHHLNKSVEDKINMIELNLERLRWQSQDFGNTYILVNVPEYHLRVYEEGEVVMDMKVIVGKEYHSTPVFRDTMTYLVLSPDWTVPTSISRTQILPVLKEDPSRFTAANYELYDSWSENAKPLNPNKIDWDAVEPHEFNYRVVQKPGPNNALGTVKFMFPNNMAIYLHDTPTDYLFDKRERKFSHGCVRIERPIDLAEYLLKNNKNWDRKKIKSNTRLSKPKTVLLNRAMPIQLVYKTAWVDENGQINFRNDIYGHDAVQHRTFSGSNKSYY
jgi:L,D-transpeptidase YcbB